MLLVLLGWLLGPLGSLLEASWKPLGGIIGHLGSLLAASWGSWRAPWVSWEPLGGLLGVSWDLLAGLEAEKWPWLEREHDF